jgi:alpha-ketoglutarate-dependent taurine dioxygenase
VTREIVLQGYELENEQLDEPGTAALDALYRELDATQLHKEFLFEPGQIQFINNRWIAHKRTGFVDWSERDRRRHLVRLWVRDSGRMFYNG